MLALKIGTAVAGCIAAMLALLQPTGETMKTVATKGRVYSRAAYDIPPLTQARIDELARGLTAE